MVHAVLGALLALIARGSTPEELAIWIPEVVAADSLTCLVGARLVLHSLVFDGVYATGSDGDGKLAFHAAPTLRQGDVADVLSTARRRILRYLERRGMLAPVAMPGDGRARLCK